MDKWIPLKEVLDKINGMSSYTWTQDYGLKYINIRIDTRDMHCLVFDGRSGNKVILERIQATIDKAEARFPELTKKRKQTTTNQPNEGGDQNGSETQRPVSQEAACSEQGKKQKEESR